MPPIPGPAQLVGLIRGQAEALATLPAALANLNRSVRSLSRALDQSRDAVDTVNRLAARADRLFDELESPLTELAPGLVRLAAVLNDPAVSEVPDLLRRARADVLPMLRNLRETQDKVASIAASTDRITSLVDDAGTRLGSLPGLLRRPFRPGPDVPGRATGRSAGTPDGTSPDGGGSEPPARPPTPRRRPGPPVNG